MQVAERILRPKTKMISILGPMVTYTMTFIHGTGHAVYSTMPTIGDLALKNGIRTERAIASSSVASQMGITASPISAAAVYYLSQMSGMPANITLVSILSVTIPATLIGVLAMSLYSMRRGLELDDDPEYQKRLQDPTWKKRIEKTTATSLDEVLPTSARNAVLIFLLALVTIVIIAMVPSIRTIAEGAKPIKMSIIIQMMMLAFGGITEMVTTYPWTFALAMFVVSVVVNSQAATCRMMLPTGLGLGLSPALLSGIMPACYGYLFIPNYPSDIATVNFDTSGTTKIGKWYFNHSFMVPGLIGVTTTCLVGYALGMLLLG